jgi:hypothetical protein
VEQLEAGDFLAADVTVERFCAAAETFLRPAVSSVVTSMVTPASLRCASSRFRWAAVTSATSKVWRTSWGDTCPSRRPFSISSATAGWESSDSGSVRDVLGDTNNLS